MTEKFQETLINFEQGIHEYLQQSIIIADTKSAGIIGLDIILLGHTISYKPTSINWVLSDMLWVLVIFFLLVSIIGSLVSLFPRLAGGKNSVIFFGEISKKKNAEAYNKTILELNVEDIVREFSIQNYKVSNIILSKYQKIRICIISTILAILTGIIFIIIYKPHCN